MSERFNNQESREILPGVEVYDRAAMEDFVYGEERCVTDPRFMPQEEGGVFRYFSPDDVVQNPLAIMRGGESAKAFLLRKAEGLVVGIVELEEAPSQESVYWVKHVSVDEAFHGDGHGRKLIEAIFAYAKKHNLSLEGSRRSEMGEERLGHLFTEIAEETGVSYTPASER